MRRISIVQGEQAVVAEPNVVVSTVLGSCVAVCLQDPVARVGGMNHFLLGEPSPDRPVPPAHLVRYGVHAMELLINEMMKHGASRERLRAHLYGGATMIAGLGSIGRENAAFARRFVETEGIPVGHVDLGGAHARRVEFLPYDGRARARQVADAPPVAAPLPAPRQLAGDVELF